MKKLLLNDLTPLNVEKALKNLGQESGYLVLNQESEWILKNAELFAEIINGHPKLKLENLSEPPYALGGLVYALKELDDKRRVELANSFANKLVEDARERVPHLQYLLNDYLSWHWLNPSDWLRTREREELHDFIVEQREYASRDLRKYINANSFVNWKINDLIKSLNKHEVHREKDHVSIIYYLFRKCCYEHYGRTSENVDTIDHRETIRKRLQNINKSKLPHLETVWKIWKR